MESNPPRFFDRKSPAHGVHEKPGVPTILFVTACTHQRAPWLADPVVHAALRATWLGARAWLVGRYVLMPDHVHFLMAPGGMDVSLESWMTLWKRTLTRALNQGPGRWQKGHWDTRMRSSEACAQKWQYVVENPVRKGLVTRAEDWPYAGELHSLEW